MADILAKILGNKINNVRVVPLVMKIITIFTVFLLLSNFTSNYINLMLNRGEQIRLANQLIVKDLKELHLFASNQREIFDFNPDLEATIANIEQRALVEFQLQKSVALAVAPDGGIFFQASNIQRFAQFPDAQALATMNQSLADGIEEAALVFTFNDEAYFGVYKYNARWDVFIVRAEEKTEFYADSVRIFRNVSFVIVGISLLCVVIGIFLIRFILRFVGVITSSIMKMQTNQSIELLDMKNAPNDDVTYLGVAFNSLASTIDNLMNIFKKFVARDIAQKAYKEREIRLEGSKKELAILFSDIKGFTYMTETLGTDIIKLLNLHYDQAIRHIHENNGDIGSIIGDALLAIFGVVSTDGQNKSYQAIKAGYLLHQVASDLRQEMRNRREAAVVERGSLTEAEERIFKAVLLEVGVGIDGGEVFYGNIGSNERMVNTVIGDNVNSSSRLEGLTRVYKVPVIVSEYIKNEVELESDEYVFMELDQVQVKGKTIGKKVYWPIEVRVMDTTMHANVARYTAGLEEYYRGDWPAAAHHFAECALEPAEVFRERMQAPTAPANWNGIWAMTEK